MEESPGPVQSILHALANGQCDPVALAADTLTKANGNASRNTYIAMDTEWSISEAYRQMEHKAKASAVPELFGLPVSLKDCCNLAGFKTSGGSKFYAAYKEVESRDSALAARLRAKGAVITGKTHLHQLAYGITGENRDYGDCLQPADAARLTGGSSSGAAASIQEGSAYAAIGTDTGGSIRVPAALCGLAGYRCSQGLGDWSGAMHLAPSFDTVGWLFRDLRDAPLLAHALLDLPDVPALSRPPRVGVLAGDVIEDCDDVVRRSLEEWQERIARSGAAIQPVRANFWFEAWDIYAPIQAHEAAQIHAGFYGKFEPAIAERLAWGASIEDEELRKLRQRLAEYVARMQAAFSPIDFLLAPATPVSRLVAGADHSASRARILRHTTPASLAGLPAVVFPSHGCGVQMLAAHCCDRALLAYAARLGQQLAVE
ncbi:MAG TPA: amidase family protein [Acidobacteriaceae bacterium]|nr:amidase family protein [Acidobacteriaceae bacterium]